MHLCKDQRLPPIAQLLRDIPPPPAPAYPTSPLTPLPSPTGSSPSLFSPQYPTWQALPSCPQSASHDSLGLCSPPSPPRSNPTYHIPRSFSVPEIKSLSSSSTLSTPRRRYRPSPERRLGRRSSAPYNIANRRFLEWEREWERERERTRSESRSPPPETPEAQSTENRPKRNNKPYTFEQEIFIIYHRIDLEMTWRQLHAVYMTRWPDLRREVGGLECAYYRTNLHMPATTDDGLLILPDLDRPGVDDIDVREAGSESIVPEHHPYTDGEVEERDYTMPGNDLHTKEENGGEAQENKKQKWRRYRGVPHLTKEVKCRVARVSLMERFPEELMEERYDWVRPEHRVLAREFGLCLLTSKIAERRRLQREAWLAAKARTQCGEMVIYF
ncbi:hypothetical protein MFIFM68171_10771 [Madurella fahalii]|uniref:Uncharacterized protein n=1 Tax=Madurella fahalii TaxID=1157608 RepID=A0ABQ0GS41_9PEZI